MSRFEKLTARFFCRLSWVAIATLPLQAAETNSAGERLLKSARPLVIAHRGYSAIAPENTRPAFERALAAGADLATSPGR